MNAPFMIRAMLCVCVVAVQPATARVTEIRITTIEPFADGANYGTTGAYERVKGTFTGELDSADARPA